MANTKKQARQERAAKRLDAQIASGVKTAKQEDFAGVKKSVTVPLTEQDIERNRQERAILRERTGK